MPNNENNNLENNSFNMNNEMTTNNAAPQQPIIEIPQTYYDKLAQEKAEEEAAKQAAEQPVQQAQQEGGLTAKIIPLILINAIVIFGIFYATVNVNVLISAASVGYVFLGAVIFAIKDKKKTEFPTSVLIGGMAAAVVCFIISMLSEDGMDLWTYYTTACAVTGIIGIIVANIITKILTDRKNIKALQTIGYLLFFAALLGGPYFAYQKWPTEFNQMIFYQKNEVIAETYEEYVLKTLKARYGIEFTCDFANKANHKTERNELMSTLTCKDPNKNTIQLKTIPYVESSNQHTIIDNFIETIYLKEIKEAISANVKQVTGATVVDTYLYPKKGCMFVGDCADCEDYYKVYKDVNDPQKRYEISSKLNLSKYLNLSTEEFINQYINANDYKVILHIKGVYDENNTNFAPLLDQTFTALNNSKLKNTYGYEITFFNFKAETYSTKEHFASGTTNDTKEFK